MRGGMGAVWIPENSRQTRASPFHRQSDASGLQLYPEEGFREPIHDPS